MFSKALLILSLTSVALATVFVTNPVASTVDTGGQPASVSWEESGSSPSLKDFGPAKISIYVGNAQQQTSLQLLNANVDVSTISSINFTPDPTIGPNGNDYFIRIESLSLKDAAQPQFPALAFSAKFTLNGMTGTFTPAILSQIAGQSTAPLAGQTTSASSAGATAGATTTASVTKTTSSKAPTGTSSSTPSATKSAASAMSMKAGWAGVAFGALIGVTMF